MKRIVLLWMGLLLGSSLFAQVTFRNLTLEEALKVAEKEGKLVFVDFTAPWCCGCKLIESELKDAKEFGSVMNKLCVSIQADVDTEYGRKLREKFIVPSLPTYLFLRPDGTLQHQFGGGSMIENFVESFWWAVDPYRCYSYYKTRYDAGERGNGFLRKYVECLDEMDWDQVRDQVKKELWNKCSDQEKIGNFSLFFNGSLKEESKEMQFLVDHREAFRNAHGRNRIDRILRMPIETQLMDIIYRDSIWSKNDLKELEKKAVGREIVDEGVRCQFDLCHAICSGKESALVKICEENLTVLDERTRYRILAACTKSVGEPKLLEAWIAVCKKYIPMAADHFFGTKKNLEALVKELEGKSTRITK